MKLPVIILSAFISLAACSSNEPVDDVTLADNDGVVENEAAPRTYHLRKSCNPNGCRCSNVQAYAGDRVRCDGVGSNTRSCHMDFKTFNVGSTIEIRSDGNKTLGCNGTQVSCTATLTPVEGTPPMRRVYTANC